MKKYSFNIIKEIDVGFSPYEYIIYALKNSREFIVEKDGKSIIIDEGMITKYLKYLQVETSWKRCFNGYVKFTQERVEQFTPLFDEPYRKIFLNIDISLVKTLITDFKEIQTETFTATKRNPFIHVSGMFPIFQLYILGKISDRDVSTNDKVFMKIKSNNFYKDKFYTYYRLPYGNTEEFDNMCFGGYGGNHSTTLENQYVRIITTTFNEHYGFHLQYGKNAKTTYELEPITEKIYNKQFDQISLLDAFYYLSQTNPEDIDPSIFVISPNIPQEILTYEPKALQ